jgi:hypothetical protein
MELNTPTRKVVLDKHFNGTIEVRQGSPSIEFYATDADGTERQCVVVPYTNTVGLMKRFNKLCRKAARLGLEEPVLTQVAKYSAYRRSDNGVSGWHRYTLWTVDAKPVHFDGWSFVATIQHVATEDGYRNVVRTSPFHEGDGVSPETRSSRPLCQHCNTARKRNDTFVIQSDDGKRMQVGRNCLKDYLGDATGAEVLNAAAYERELRDFMDDDWGGFGGSTGYDVVGVLAMTIAAVDRFGFTSRGKARDWGLSATADLIHFTLEADRERHDLDLRRKWEQDGDRFKAPWGEAEREQAATIIDWADTIPDDTDSDYLWNLKTVCSMGGITGRELGLLCSAVSAYERAVKGEARRVEREALKDTSDHFGAAGDKIGRKLSAADKRKGATAHDALTVTVKMTKLFDGHYGTNELVSMTDAAGNVFKWFASGEARSDDGERITEGETYTLVATIKGHGEYAGVKETNLNRCVLSRA